jgi:endonuclease/exonuclease/phosphatase (EEP) superfamily protein YafD
LELKLRELDNTFPYSIKYPLENTYGMILYSKLPLKNKKINFLADKDVPSFYASVRLPSGKSFDLYSIHPKPPKAGINSYKWDAEVLITGKKIREHNRPALVAGDLNDVGWSRTTKRSRNIAGWVIPGRAGVYLVHIMLKFLYFDTPSIISSFLKVLD